MLLIWWSMWQLMLQGILVQQRSALLPPQQALLSAQALHGSGAVVGQGASIGHAQSHLWIATSVLCGIHRQHRHICRDAGNSSNVAAGSMRKHREPQDQRTRGAWHVDGLIDEFQRALSSTAFSKGLGPFSQAVVKTWHHSQGSKFGRRILQVNDALDGKGYRPLRLRGFNVPVEISVHLTRIRPGGKRWILGRLEVGAVRGHVQGLRAVKVGEDSVHARLLSDRPEGLVV
mmetsp:Transcript_31918/g.68774  ORF Transcript_31918/g.68774 Transcript_31918/m.68774 type:complete len:231 (+) Transcript_31918:143-835(+)